MARNRPSKAKLGVSACLLGEKVRHDGGHRQDAYVVGVLSQYFDWVPVCPEVEVGMGVPREPVRLVGSAEQSRLVGRTSGQDWTGRMEAYSQKRLDELAKENLSGFIFKSRSPSSGAFRVKIYNAKGNVAGYGSGKFAGAFMRRFPLVPVEEEGRLHDPGLRENFIERVFSYQRLQRLFAGSFSRAEVIAFHTDQKLLLMAHSPQHYQVLGRKVATLRDQNARLFAQEYTAAFMAALAKPATPARHENVLLHILGYFKPFLTPEEKNELLQIIADYKQQLVPLVVPMTLITHYVRKYRVAWLERQYYLQPHPKELMLRNHV